MTGILSTPCTAPLMGTAAAWAVQQEASTTLATFAAIGAGMAMPYFVLSAWPKLIEKMPRVGPASELVKQVMGLQMLAAAAYFIGVGVSSLLNVPPAPPSIVYWWIVAALVAAAGVWLIRRTWQITAKPIPRIVWTIAGILTIGSTISGGAMLTDRGPIDWDYYTPQRFDEALAAGEVVVLDFTAEWCLNCKVIEHSVLFSDRVAAALSAPGVRPIKVDITSKANVEGATKLREVGEVSIPLLVVYAPTGEIVLQSHYYTAEQVVAAIEAARAVETRMTN
jgi:thiol:disulfide interchange protein DsbD